MGLLARMLDFLTSKMKSMYTSAFSLIFKLGKFAGLVALILALIPVVTLFFSIQNNKHPSEYTVKVTNPDGSSGGSGVIIKSSNEDSFVLTNYHVCDVLLKRGGKITKVNGTEHAIVSMARDGEHDLCMVKVLANLGAAIDVAEESPGNYSEALITGHPHLMPNILSKGHFGGRDIITLMWDVKRCSKKDLENPRTGLICFFVGGLPVLRSFEARVVSALIMPGSSGSAVLNDKKELSGLVFAGNGKGLSYAYAVPLEAIRSFLYKGDDPTDATKGFRAPWNDGSSQFEDEDSEDEESFTASERAEVIARLTAFKSTCKGNIEKNINKEQVCKYLNDNVQGELL